MRTKFENIAAILGYISLFIVATAILFKLMSWPGGGVLLMFGCAFTVFPFLVFFGIAKAMAYPHDLGKALIIVCTLFASVAMTGILFKLMQWPGAGMMMVVGFFIGPIFGYLPLLLYDIKKSNSKRFFKPASQFLGMILACLAFGIWGTSPSVEIILGTTAITKNLDHVNSKMRKDIENYINFENPTEIDIMAGEIYAYIKMCKTAILKSEREKDTEALINNVDLIRGKKNYDIVNREMASGYRTESGKTRQFELLEMVDRFERKHAEITGNKAFRIKHPLENKSIDPYQNNNPLFDFEHKPVILAMNQLSSIEQMVLSMQLEYYERETR